MRKLTKIAAAFAGLCLAGATACTALYARELAARVEELGQEGYRRGVRYSRMLKELEEELRGELLGDTPTAEDAWGEETVPAPSVGGSPEEGDGSVCGDGAATENGGSVGGNGYPDSGNGTPYGEDGGSTEAVTVPPLRAPEIMDPEGDSPADGVGSRPDEGVTDGGDAARPDGGAADGGDASRPHDGKTDDVDASKPDAGDPDGGKPSRPVATVPAPYLVTEERGTICVLDGAGEVIRRVNVFVMTLPEADRVALSAGIPVFSEEELTVLLQKYE